MRPMLIAATLLCLMPTLARAEFETRKLTYKVGDTEVESVLVYDKSVDSKRPGLVMVPNWMGVNDDQIAKARTIAGRDYVILVADVYGTGTRPKNPDEAGKAAGAMYQDLGTLRARVAAAMEQLVEADAPVDDARRGAIGFCFGGATVLELARSGADIAGVVSFHGSLGTTMPAKAGEVKAKVLVLNGADDGFVAPERIDGFEKEMKDAGADWQFVNFGGAVHCFAEPDANGAVPGCVYNERAAKRSFKMMRDFFAEAFAAQ